jgi:UPF0288 family protein (methanogenesis marker protein 3)
MHGLLGVARGKLRIAITEANETPHIIKEKLKELEQNKITEAMKNNLAQGIT